MLGLELLTTSDNKRERNDVHDFTLIDNELTDLSILKLIFGHGFSDVLIIFFILNKEETSKLSSRKFIDNPQMISIDTLELLDQLIFILC